MARGGVRQRRARPSRAAIRQDQRRHGSRGRHQLRNGANFGARLIRKLDPAAGRALNSNSLLPLCWPPLAHKFSKKCKPVLGKVRRLVTGNTHQTTGAWPDKAALYGADPAWHDYVEKVLEGDRLFAEELFDRTRVHECWNALKNGDREVADDIEKLLQLGILTEFVQGQNQSQWPRAQHL